MKPPDLNDRQLGRLLSLVVVMLVLCIVYLAILLPFSGNAAFVGGAIAALGTVVGTIITVRAWRGP